MSTSETKAEFRQALAFGFASPIVGLTLALIIGMATQDLFHTIDIWMGVVIVGLIGASLVLGGHFAGMAVNAAEATAHKGAPKAAAILNLVAISIWSYVALITSVTYGISAIASLEVWPPDSRTLVSMRTLTSDDWTNHLLPAFTILFMLLVAVYLFVVLRSKGRKA